MSTSPDPYQVSRSPREVWEQTMRHHMNSDFDSFANMFAVDAVMEVPFAPEGFPRRMEGRDAIRRTLGPFWEAAKKRGRRMLGVEPSAIHESRDPEVVIVEFDVLSELDGEPLRMSYVHILRARAGQIVSLRDHMDSSLLTSRLKKLVQ